MTLMLVSAMNDLGKAEDALASDDIRRVALLFPPLVSALWLKLEESQR